MTTPNPVVQDIIETALTASSPVSLLSVAVRETAKGGRVPERRKLTDGEAFAAAAVVSRLISRHGLKPTVVLQKDGRASGPEQTYRFYLTDEEMKAGSVREGRRLAKGVGAHFDNVRAIAQAARQAGQEVDKEAMQAELADAVSDFLEQFRDEPEPDPDAELAQDVARVAVWLGSPGRRFELAKTLDGAGYLELDYSPRTGQMTHVGREGADFAHGVMPWLPLRLRPVARGDAAIYVRDAAELAEEAARKAEGGFYFYPCPKLEEIGRESLIACQSIGLGVSLERGRTLRMTFTVDPVFYAGTSFRAEVDDTGNKLPKHIKCIGIPQDTPGIASDGIHYVGLDGKLQVWCPEFHSYLRQIQAGDYPGSISEAIYGRRYMPVTADTCRLLLDGGDRDAMFPWRWFADLVEETVLRESVISDDGTESWLYRDRFAELLYRPDEKGLAGLLEAEAAKRAEAYEEFVSRSASGARRRKLDFRRRMRG